MLLSKRFLELKKKLENVSYHILIKTGESTVKQRQTLKKNPSSFI